jgi:hypothetical protein
MSQFLKQALKLTGELFNDVSAGMYSHAGIADRLSCIVSLLDQADADTLLSTEEAQLCHDGLGIWSSDYNSAPNTQIEELRAHLRTLGAKL